MKKILYIAIAIVTACTFSSCSQDLLEIPQKGVVAWDDFYNNSPESAEQAAIAVYQSVGQMYTTGVGFGAGVGWCIAPSMFVLTNAPSDDTYYGSGNKGDHVFGLEINEYRDSFSSTSDVIGQNYLICYQLIRNCNLVIENFTGTDAVSKQAIADARFFRALAHLHLAIYWGDPVLVETTLNGSERPENTPHADVLQFCINEFDAASKDLPSKSGLNDKKLAVRPTKEAALAFKGKAQMFAGDYAGAQASLKSVISSGKYALVPGEQMIDLFAMAGDGNQEKILDLNFVDFPGVSLTGKAHFQKNSSCYWRDLKAMPSMLIQPIGWGGGGNPSISFVEAIVANEGDSYRRKAWIRSYEEVIGDFDYDALPGATREEKLKSDKVGLSSASYFGNCGWFSLKFAPRRADLVNNSTTNTQENQTVMRYAEVLLLYAEACAQTGDSDGLQYLNMIAERAGAPTYGSLTLDNVKKEKRFEMYLEGTRFADLVRWGDAATVLKDQGKYVPSFVDKFATTGVHKAELVNDPAITNYNSSYGFKSGKNERMPFPFSEVQKNENIKQNPGWN